MVGEQPDDAGGSLKSKTIEVENVLDAPTRKFFETLLTFNKLCLRFMEEEKGFRLDLKAAGLKAVSEMKKNGTVLYPEKRFGALPGIAVGQEFSFWAEMLSVGIHHLMSGIDYISNSSKKPEEGLKNYEVPLAVSIVLSANKCKVDLDNSEEIVYDGERGDKQGYLALKNSMEQKVPVRVVRLQIGSNKPYTYDGLYEVVYSSVDNGINGDKNIYKFRIKPLEGQPLLTEKKDYSYSRMVDDPPIPPPET